MNYDGCRPRHADIKSKWLGEEIGALIKLVEELAGINSETTAAGRPSNQAPGGQP